MKLGDYMREIIDTQNGKIVKYVVNDKEGNKYKYNFIGANHTASGAIISGFTSSYSDEIDIFDTIAIENGFGDHRYAKIGNIKEAYDILKENVNFKNPNSFLEICECIQKTINDYFGNYSNFSSRIEYFPSEDEIESEKDYGKISDIAHKNAAACVERAVLSQNLLKSLGIDATLKFSGFMNNGKKEIHAYNLVKNEDKYYIFDSTQPTLRDDAISPIICEIPEYVYNEMKQPIKYGYSVEVSHYNPLMGKDYNVIYDAGRNQIYNVVNENVKFK